MTNLCARIVYAVPLIASEMVVSIVPLSISGFGLGKLSRRMFIAGAFVVLSLLFVTSSAQAASLTYVRGHVYDTDGSPLVGVDVTVSMKYYQSGEWHTRSTATVSSATGGYYLATFGGLTGPDWQDGDTIEVFATKSGVGQSPVSTSVADTGELFQTPDVDVQFETVIPQLGGFAGFLISAGILGVVAVVAMRVWKRAPATRY